MKFKLDENFGRRVAEECAKAGHEVHTVFDEGLQGAADRRIFETCCSESLCLVTLDLDFADVTRFPPDSAHGIIVLRPPKNPSPATVVRLVRHFLEATTRDSPERSLWIVEIDRIRIHQRD